MIKGCYLVTFNKASTALILIIPVKNTLKQPFAIVRLTDIMEEVF